MATTALRPPAVAGLFYPADRSELAREVGMLLAGAARGGKTPKAIIAPHAGYVYSGPIAAAAYARLKPARDIISKVILLGPVHRVAVCGLALPAAQTLVTPLGNIDVDAEAVAQLQKLPQITTNGAAHAPEHALEVQLPFLQTVLAKFSVVPLAVGDASAGEVAEVIDLLWGGAETLIVVSSDLSHYLNYNDARTADAATVRAVLELRSDISHHQACGATPINGLMLAAQRRGMQAELLDLHNSGDTAGDKQRVVGYGAFAFHETNNNDNGIH